MGFLFTLIIIGVIVYFVLKNGNPNAKAIKAISKGKTPDQVKVIEYFCAEGCLAKKMSDEEYLNMVTTKRDSMNFKQRALDKIGLDEDEVSEIPPAMFEGFVFRDAYAKQTAAGKWVSSAYQVSWVFFSAAQIYLYSHTFFMDEDKKKESTDEFFYKDVTSFSTMSETDTAHGLQGNKFDVTSEQFAMVVPGDKLTLAMGDVENADAIIQGMKQKLREKKM